MYTPAVAPSNLTEMRDFLTPMIDDGLFDSVAFDSADSPTKIVCTQDGNTIIEITMSSTNFIFKPFVAANIAASPTGRMPTMAVAFAMRCKGGAMFSAANYAAGAGSSGMNFIIGKASSGKTAFIGFSAPGIGSVNAAACYVSCFGDNTAIQRYSNGFMVVPNGLSNDRTMLQEIPVFGALGSTDIFDTAYFRNMANFSEAGRQTIDGKSYGCAGYWAILDE